MNRRSFRKATESDIDVIECIYNEVHDAEEAGRCSTGWERGIYPTRKTAEDSVKAGDMFVEELNGQIVAAGRINREQVDVYEKADWSVDASPDEVMVLHTLVVSSAGQRDGNGTAFVGFYERYAQEHGCAFLRIDTNERNRAARSLYRRLGYREVSVIPCVFNGLESVRLVCLEKILK